MFCDDLSVYVITLYYSLQWTVSSTRRAGLCLRFKSLGISRHTYIYTSCGSNVLSPSCGRARGSPSLRTPLLLWQALRELGGSRCHHGVAVASSWCVAMAAGFKTLCHIAISRRHHITGHDIAVAPPWWRRGDAAQTPCKCHGNTAPWVLNIE